MVWSGSLGLADRASNRPVTNTTPFRLGFISKTITSLAVLVLQERQVLSLDAILKDIIPEVGIENRWTETDPIRLVHVLEHTAGFDDIHLREFAANEPEITLLKCHPIQHHLSQGTLAAWNTYVVFEYWPSHRRVCH